MAVPKWARENMAKTGGMPSHGVVSKPSPFHSSDVKHLADGTPSEDDFKRMGLEASDRYNEIEKSQEVGALDKLKGGFGRLFDRLKAGNIDAPGSDAYNKYGAGLGKAEYEKEQQFKQSRIDSENARRDYVPDTADSIARKMGRVTMGPTVGEAKTEAVPKPVVDQTQLEWDSLQKSSTPPEKKEKKIFSEPTMPTVSTDKAEDKSGQKAPTLRKTNKRQQSNTRGVSSGDKKVYLPDNPRPPADNDSRPSKPYPKGKPGASDSRPSKPIPKGSKSENDARPSKPYPSDARPKGSANSTGESEVQAAGARYAATKAALDRAPANTSATARKALEAAVEAARQDYEAKAKKSKR